MNGKLAKFIRREVAKVSNDPTVMSITTESGKTVYKVKGYRREYKDAKKEFKKFK